MISPVTAIEYGLLNYVTNAVWQVPVVLTAAWIAARFAQRTGAALEHRVWVTGMLLGALLPAFRIDPGRVFGEVLGLLTGQSGMGTGLVQTSVGQSIANGFDMLRLPQRAVAVLAATFLLSVGYFGARLVWGLRRTEEMRGRGLPFAMAGEVSRVWLRQEAEFEAAGWRRMPEVLLVEQLVGPVTIGALRPALLLPRAFAENARPDDLEAVVAHELAHVRRWDFAKNLAYEVITLPVAWHPALWMMRTQMAESREMVCDAMAADAVAGRERYARSLLRVAGLIAQGGQVKTFHAIGMFDANSFERRIMNLTKKRVKVGILQRIGIAAACAVVAMGTCATAMALRVGVAPQVQAIAAGGAEALKVEPGQMKSTSKTPPIYPAEARAKKDTIDGPVMLAVIIGKDGAVESIHVQQSLRADYDRSALDAVRTWQWEPFMVNGEPTEVETTVTVNYSLAN